MNAEIFREKTSDVELTLKCIKIQDALTDAQINDKYMTKYKMLMVESKQQFVSAYCKIQLFYMFLFFIIECWGKQHNVPCFEKIGMLLITDI